MRVFGKVGQPRDVPARRPGRLRDRRGRGLRGSLAPAEVPLPRSAAERFDDVAAAAVARVDRRWSRELTDVQFVVEDVPDLSTWDRDWIPLGRTEPAEAGLPARVVLHRRPIQTRARGEMDLRRLVLDTVVDQVAELIGVDPEEIDPGYNTAD